MSFQKNTIMIINFLKNIFGSHNSQQLLEAIQNGATLIDVRSKAEFNSGSIDKAINIPLNEISKHMEKLKNKGSIVVFCRSGMRSKQAQNMLQQAGIPHVFNGGSLMNMKKLIS